MKNIINVPEWAQVKALWVVRNRGEQVEFFDAWDAIDEMHANAQAWEINGKVIENK